MIVVIVHIYGGVGTEANIFDDSMFRCRCGNRFCVFCCCTIFLFNQTICDRLWENRTFRTENETLVF